MSKPRKPGHDQQGARHGLMLRAVVRCGGAPEHSVGTPYWEVLA
jgi:hypothetical protein